MLLVTALDGTFNKQAWADHFAATLHANARETKSQADILRAICAAYKLFQLFFNSCGDDVGNAYNQKCIKQAVAAIKAAAELMEIGEIWTVKMKPLWRKVPPLPPSVIQFAWPAWYSSMRFAISSSSAFDCRQYASKLEYCMGTSI